MAMGGEWREQLQDNKDTDLPLDHSKIDYFDIIVDLCESKGVILCIAIAPAYVNYSKEEAWQAYIKKVAKERHLIYFDYTGDGTFIQHPEWYYNPAHFNGTGASIYSSAFAHDLKEALE